MPSDPASLEQFIVSRMSDKWFQFGIHLGVAEKTLKDLDGSDLIPDNVARCVVMLHHWIREAGPIKNNLTELDQAMKQTLTEEVKVTYCQSVILTCLLRTPGQYSKTRGDSLV